MAQEPSTLKTRWNLWSTPYSRILLVAFVLATVPTVLVGIFESPFWFRILSLGLIWALFAVGYDICFGYTGMLSFGHAAFLGIGGYGTAKFLETGPAPFQNVWVTLIFALLLAGLVAAIIGYFAIQTQDIALALVTFAFSNVIFLGALADPCESAGIAWCSTNSFAGLSVTLPSLGFGLLDLSLYSPSTFYYFTLFVLLTSYFVVRRILATPLGRAFEGVRENRQRMEVLGYDTDKYRFVAFMLSGGISGLAGALLTMNNLGADPNSLLHWENSGLIVLMTFLGGPGTLLGPALGGALVAILEFVISSSFSPGLWRFLLGWLFIGLILSLPKGLHDWLVSGYKFVFEWIKDRL